MKRKPGKLIPKSKTFAGYLAALSPDKRRALKRLQRDIRAVVPEAEECISYGVPSFRLNGRFLVAMGVGAEHCSFYPGSALQAYKHLLKGYDTSKGTIRFPPNRPLPAALVRKIVRARIAKGRFDGKA